MIVYAETNFLLEIAYLQEGSESCREILDLAGNDKLTLSVPAFSMIEARQTWNRRSSEHRALQNQLQPIIRQLARSGPFSTVTESSLELLKALESGEDTRTRLEDLLAALPSMARILPLDSEIVARARRVENNLGLSPSDAVVYATVLFHLQSAPAGRKCFLNRDSKGFANPDVYDELDDLGCKLIVSFENGRDFIRSELRSGAG